MDLAKWILLDWGISWCLEDIFYQRNTRAIHSFLTRHDISD